MKRKWVKEVEWQRTTVDQTIIPK